MTFSSLPACLLPACLLASGLHTARLLLHLLCCCISAHITEVKAKLAFSITMHMSPLWKRNFASVQPATSVFGVESASRSVGVSWWPSLAFAKVDKVVQVKIVF